MQSPLISIIVPAYNVYQYLTDCLDSVFNQNVDNSYYEVIVIDDCSPYGEKAIVDTYLEKCPNIRYIRHEKNKRQGGARNTGLRAAQGEYVMFLDADDCIKYQNTFSILIECVKKYQSVVLRSTVLETFSSDCLLQRCLYYITLHFYNNRATNCQTCINGCNAISSNSRSK